MRKIAFVVCALVAAGCGVAPVQSDGGSPGDAWVLPPIEYEVCPAQCVPTCGPRDSRDCERADPVCQGCDARCWMTAHPDTLEPELATCHSTPEPACRAGSAECMRRAR